MNMSSRWEVGLKVKKLTDTAKIPTKANISDAGFDLYSDVDINIESGKTVIINTGIALGIPDGYCGLIWDRSSLGSKGIHRHAGVVDSGYRGEIKVCLNNTSDSSYEVSKGDRIAQILIQRNEPFRVEECEDLSDTDRGLGGFGSSGK